jgi:Protein of unknown function (DUF4197)
MNPMLEHDARMRRLLVSAALLAAAQWLPRNAAALSLADLSKADASAGVKAALERGATVAVGLLGQPDGFWGNDKLRIPLPEWLRRAESALTLAGRGAEIEALKLGVNRAAEKAVPESKALLIDAVKKMTVADAKGILSGGDDSVTRFFADKTRAPLTTRFLPVVTRSTEKIGLARQYNDLAERAAQFGLVKGDAVKIENHVTTKALDGLYQTIGDEERKIRNDPVGTGSAILKKVFGSLN